MNATVTGKNERKIDAHKSHKKGGNLTELKGLGEGGRRTSRSKDTGTPALTGKPTFG